MKVINENSDDITNIFLSV